jgi:hypothetical protein
VCEEHEVEIYTAGHNDQPVSLPELLSVFYCNFILRSELKVDGLT